MLKFKREKGDDKPIFPRLGTLSFVDFMFCCLNMAIGTGALRLGTAFISGFLFSHLLNTFVAIVTLYSLKLYVLSAAYYQENTFEDIWSHAFPKYTVFIPEICSIVKPLQTVMSYTSFLQGSLVTILTQVIRLINPNSDDIISRLGNFKMLIGFLLVIVVWGPTSFCTNVRYTVYISYVSVSLFLIVSVYIIAQFVVSVNRDGFDPQHRFKLFDLKDHVTSSIMSFAFAYNLYPFPWPGLKHHKDPSMKSLSRTFIFSIVTCYFLYAIVGTFSYLTFFDTKTGSIIIDFYPSETFLDKLLIIIGNIFTFVYIALTIPFRINGCRYAILNAFYKKSEFPPDVWGPTGITVALIALALANSDAEVRNIISSLGDVLTIILMFVSAVFYLRAYGTKNKLHLVGAILEAIITLAAFVFIIYNNYIA